MHQPATPADPDPQRPDLPLASLGFGDLLDRLAAKTPTPGGGAAACAAGALAAAMASMVVAYSLGRKSLVEHQPELESASHRLTTTRALFLQLAEEDAAAYGLLNELGRLAENDPRRVREWGPALQASIAIPRAAMAAACELLRLCEALAPITNPRLRSDLAIAAVLAQAANRASSWNVWINLQSLAHEEATAASATMELALGEGEARSARVEAACRKAP